MTDRITFTLDGQTVTAAVGGSRTVAACGSRTCATAPNPAIAPTGTVVPVWLRSRANGSWRPRAYVSRRKGWRSEPPLTVPSRRVRV